MEAPLPLYDPLPNFVYSLKLQHKQQKKNFYENLFSFAIIIIIDIVSIS